MTAIMSRATYFDSSKAYAFHLLSKYDSLSHIMTMIPYKGRWYILDSYINCRHFECKIVDPLEIMAKIESICSEWNDGLWYQLSGCHEHSHQQSITAQVMEFKFNIDGILPRYQMLYEEYSSLIDASR